MFVEVVSLRGVWRTVASRDRNLKVSVGSEEGEIENEVEIEEAFWRLSPTQLDGASIAVLCG